MTGNGGEGQLAMDTVERNSNTYDEDGVGANGAVGGGRASSAPLLGSSSEPTILELSRVGRRAWSLPETNIPEYPLSDLLPAEHLRDNPLPLVELSERDIVAHFTRLAHRQYSIDLGAYPLGSCTMKYNPKVTDEISSLAGLSQVHPAASESISQGWLQLLVELEEALCEITGMHAATLQPPAGAAGELCGLLLMRAWHASRGEDSTRRVIVIPDSAHGTNPASVSMAGFEVATVSSGKDGLVDETELDSVLNENLAGMMLTNPNTLGLFESNIVHISQAVHEAGGLMYYDGANMNAIMGIATPADMGFDIVHMNMHKTFATPHGGGGPGAGPVAVTEGLAPFLPGPRPVRSNDDGGQKFHWEMPPRSIGRLHSWYGNALVLARAYAYIRMNGGEGLQRVAQLAVLNANWLRKRISSTFEVPYGSAAMHEFVVSLANFHKLYGIHAMDVAKRLIDKGFHPPTVAFPLIVEEALMIEPTETESPETLEAFARALEDIAEELASVGPEPLKMAPHHAPVGRVDEARAARNPVLTWDME